MSKKENVVPKYKNHVPEMLCQAIAITLYPWGRNRVLMRRGGCISTSGVQVEICETKHLCKYAKSISMPTPYLVLAHI